MFIIIFYEIFGKFSVNPPRRATIMDKARLFIISVVLSIFRQVSGDLAAHSARRGPNAALSLACALANQRVA